MTVQCNRYHYPTVKKSKNVYLCCLSAHTHTQWVYNLWPFLKFSTVYVDFYTCGDSCGVCVFVCVGVYVCVPDPAAMVIPSVNPASSQLDPNTSSIVSLIQDY